jgi:hypothetical protein
MTSRQKQLATDQVNELLQPSGDKENRRHDRGTGQYADPNC